MNQPTVREQVRDGILDAVTKLLQIVSVVVFLWYAITHPIWLIPGAFVGLCWLFCKLISKFPEPVQKAVWTVWEGILGLAFAGLMLWGMFWFIHWMVPLIRTKHS